MKTISGSEIRRAALAWAENCSSECSLYFYQFIGTASFTWDVGNSVWAVTDDAYHKIQLLLSPHSRTIIKAWAAKNAK